MTFDTACVFTAALMMTFRMVENTIIAIGTTISHAKLPTTVEELEIHRAYDMKRVKPYVAQACTALIWGVFYFLVTNPL